MQFVLSLYMHSSIPHIVGDVESQKIQVAHMMYFVHHAGGNNIPHVLTHKISGDGGVCYYSACCSPLKTFVEPTSYVDVEGSWTMGIDSTAGHARNKSAINDEVRGIEVS